MPRSFPKVIQKIRQNPKFSVFGVTGHAASEPLPSTWIEQAPAHVHGQGKNSQHFLDLPALGKAMVVLLVLWDGFGHHGAQHSN